MSTISIEIPESFLIQPAVARAIANLTLALGGHDGTDGTAAPATRKVAPAYAAPAPAPTHSPPAKPAASAADAELQARWAIYVDGLSENSRKFLSLLEKWGRLTLDEAVEMLSLPGGKALGGITGPIGRWTPKNGFAVPYTTHEDPHGVRYWIWTGVAAA